MKRRFTIAVAALGLLAPVVAPQSELREKGYLTSRERQRIERMQRDISAKEMQQLLEKFNRLDRISGGRGEAQAAALLTEALERHGVPHKVHRFARISVGRCARN